jgi:hypothetical protein
MGLPDDPSPFETQLEPVPLMPVLQSDDPNLGIDKSASRSYAVLRELRGRSVTIGWALAALVATGGWLYFIARAGWSLTTWLLE